LHSGSAKANGVDGGRIDVHVGSLIDAGQWQATGSAGVGGAIDIHATRHLEQTASGAADASGAAGGGSVRVKAGESAWLSGRLDASSSGGVGGQVSATAATLTLAGAQLTADGAAGGGLVRVGGGWQGGDADLANATSTLLMPQTHLGANASVNGDGGTVVVWSQESTVAGASIAAQGAGAGHGGKVEVSSHGALTFAATVDVSAPSGVAGSVLLDPQDIVIGDTTSVVFDTIALLDPAPAASNAFGSSSVRRLDNGNCIVASPLDDTTAVNAGAVRMYSPDGTLLATLSGASANDQVGSGAPVPGAAAVPGVTLLTGNGNYVVTSPKWNNGVNTAAGAVTWRAGSDTSSALVSSANSLVGELSGSQVGAGGIVALPNGNFVVRSPSWDRPLTPLTRAPDAGAVTWGDGSGAVLLSGPVSATNSLVGTQPNDRVGGGSTMVGPGIVVLTNGNYVVRSPDWANGSVNLAGAATWGSGATGVTGEISAANSLVGQTAADFVSHTVTALTNGNYVVGTPAYDNSGTVDVGAATWGDGTTGAVGLLGVNALTGAFAGDNVGERVTTLTNGNYVVSSPRARVDGQIQAGLATWRDGTGVLDRASVANVSNSISGSQIGDQVGDFVKALPNGHYIVISKTWSNGSVGQAGAVTWADGTVSTAGAVSTANSLYGTTFGDRLGLSGALVLPNSAYVVISPGWTDTVAGVSGAGAVTWLRGDQTTASAVSTANSLVGSHDADFVGSGTGTVLTNGNYVIRSPDWSTDTAAHVGAVTWGDGTRGITGYVTSANSLVGSNAMDRVGINTVKLSNGNYVVTSDGWGGGKGAATWGDGTRGVTGEISAANSLVGSSSTDRVSQFDVRALTNGNYVVSSPSWSGDRGAISWGNGLGGTVGVVSAANSLVGVTPTVGLVDGDALGYGGVGALANGDYFIVSPLASLGALTHAGAVTLGNGRSGLSGVISESNSRFGSAIEEQLSGAFLSSAGTGLVIFSGAGFTGVRRVEVIWSPSASVAPTTRYAALQGRAYTVGAAELAALLGSAADVTLQASNDITVAREVTVTGLAGALTLQAGRSVFVDADITTTGDVTLIANDDGPGVVRSDREAGAATIMMRGDAVIDAGPTGAVRVEMRSGNGDASTVGDIALATVRSKSLVVTVPPPPPAPEVTPDAPDAPARLAASALRPWSPAEGRTPLRFANLPLTVLDPQPDPALELTSLDRR
ncbi:MAG TPA: hypothetical protein VLJ86_00065, partial [Ramlibacter sp.]|nr:hypothetical protein [Ramlibacter sp.]